MGTSVPFDVLQGRKAFRNKKKKKKKTVMDYVKEAGSSRSVRFDFLDESYTSHNVSFDVSKNKSSESRIAGAPGKDGSDELNIDEFQDTNSSKTSRIIKQATLHEKKREIKKAITSIAILEAALQEDSSSAFDEFNEH